MRHLFSRRGRLCESGWVGAYIFSFVGGSTARLHQVGHRLRHTAMYTQMTSATTGGVVLGYKGWACSRNASRVGRALRHRVNVAPACGHQRPLTPSEAGLAKADISGLAGRAGST